MESRDEREKKEEKRRKEPENAVRETLFLLLLLLLLLSRPPAHPRIAPGALVHCGGAGGGVRRGDCGRGREEGSGSEGGLDLYGVKGDTWYVGLAVIH